MLLFWPWFWPAGAVLATLLAPVPFTCQYDWLAFGMSCSTYIGGYLGVHVPICLVVMWTGSCFCDWEIFTPPYSPPHWSCQPPPVVSSCSKCRTCVCMCVHVCVCVCVRGGVEQPMKCSKNKANWFPYSANNHSNHQSHSWRQWQVMLKGRRQCSSCLQHVWGSL